MKSKRLLFYLLLNVLVSALTTAAVLWGWQRYVWPRRGPAAATPPAAPLPTPTPSPAGATALEPYQVQPGDSLESIACSFGVEAETLQAVNGLAPDAPLGVGQILLVPATSPPDPAPTSAPQGDPQALHIAAVVGAGDAGSEYVQLEYAGGGEISLQGWQIRAPDGRAYTFPALILHSGGAVRLHTAAGADTVVDLYWGLDAPLWASGQAVSLLTPAGVPQETFRIP